jgi:hypothetical protein
MSGHEHDSGGNLTAIELAEERMSPIGTLISDAANVSVAGFLGILFMYLPHVDPTISQSGKMDGGGHGGHGGH